jgi:hypothetical protein
MCLYISPLPLFPHTPTGAHTEKQAERKGTVTDCEVHRFLDLAKDPVLHFILHPSLFLIIPIYVVAKLFHNI